MNPKLKLKKNWRGGGAGARVSDLFFLFYEESTPKFFFFFWGGGVGGRGLK